MRPLSDQAGAVPDQQVSHRPFVAIDELRLRGPGLHFVEDRAPLLKVHPVDPGGRPELLDLRLFYLVLESHGGRADRKSVV